jgi:hypothetical protein
MALFTIEVQGRPVLVFSEESRGSAETLVGSTIGPDLAEFEEDGEPVWDGEDELLVRDAEPAEAAQWEEGFAEAVRSDGAGEEDRIGYAVFLIEVDGPIEDDDDDEEEDDEEEKAKD